MQILINVAENDDHGRRSGKAAVIGIGDVVRFEAINFDGYSFKHDRKKGIDRFRLHRKIYPYLRSVDWLGNMIFNGYWLNSIIACELINELWRSPKWTWDSIDGELENELEKYNVILQGDLERICAALHN